MQKRVKNLLRNRSLLARQWLQAAGQPNGQDWLGEKQVDTFRALLEHLAMSPQESFCTQGSR